MHRFLTFDCTDHVSFEVNNPRADNNVSRDNLIMTSIMPILSRTRPDSFMRYLLAECSHQPCTIFTKVNKDINSSIPARGGKGKFLVGHKCQDVELLWGILAKETEVQEVDLGSDVKYWSNTGKMVYSYPSRGALYSVIPLPIHISYDKH